jgi:hypothetical protein
MTCFHIANVIKHGAWQMANGGWGVDFGGSPHRAMAVVNR